MSERRVEVTAQVVGETDPSLRMVPVWIVLDQNTLPVRAIIARAVETQVNELRSGRRKMDLKKARRVLIRQYLSQDALESERPRLGDESPEEQASVEDREHELDPALEAERAMDAFESGRVVMIVDGRQVHSLDDEVIVTPETKVKFLRLTPLVGG
jgi:hypothetical protein